MKSDRVFLERTLELAVEAFNEKSYPIGCVITDENNQIVTSETNKVSSRGDITSHAEILAMRKLGKKIDKHAPGNYTLYSSLEPCFGCSFFIARTNIRRVVSALTDPHKGGISKIASQEQFLGFFNNVIIINEPFSDLRNQSLKLMHDYFSSIDNQEAAGRYKSN